MKYSSIESVVLKENNLLEIKNIFIKNKVGLSPCYIDMSDFDFAKTQAFITTMELVIKDMNISPLFPYPCYIITKYNSIMTTFPILEDLKQIPEFFKVQLNRITNKEQKLVDKIEIIKSQIQNEEVTKRLDDYRVNIMPQKMIKSLCKEGMFLEKILNQINEQSKNR